jgi:hypothetical protein
MTLEAEELASDSLTDLALPSYPRGGEVSALTLLEDVQAIRVRLEGIEVSMRQLGLRMEELRPSPNDSALVPAAVGSMDELRKALLADLPADLLKQAGRMRLLLVAMFVTLLAGLGGLGWMLRQIE